MSENTDLHSSRRAISSDPYKQRRKRLIHNGTFKSFIEIFFKANQTWKLIFNHKKSISTLSSLLGQRFKSGLKGTKVNRTFHSFKFEVDMKLGFQLHSQFDFIKITYFMLNFELII